MKLEFRDDLLELLAKTILFEENELWSIFVTTQTSVSRQNNPLLSSRLVTPPRAADL